MLGADYTTVGDGPPLGIHARKDLRGVSPAAMAINPRNGEIALADASRQQFVIFSPGQGNTIVHTCQQGSYDEPASKFRKPSGVNYNSQGHLAVVDEEACTVQIHTDLGRAFSRVFGKAGAEVGEMLQPKAVAWVLDESVAVLEGTNVRVQFFTAEVTSRNRLQEATDTGQPLGCVGGSLTLTRPVGISFHANGGLQDETLWPRWFHRLMARDEMIAKVASEEPKTFLVRHDKDLSFEMVYKNRPGVVDLKRDRSMTWLESFVITYKAGLFYTPPITIIQLAPSAPLTEEQGSRQDESKGQKPKRSMNRADTEGSDEEEDDEEDDNNDHGDGGHGDKEGEEAAKAPEERSYGFTSLTETVRFLADYAGCRWPEDGRRRALLAVLDSSMGHVQMYGYVAAQSMSMGVGELPLSKPTFFTMNRFGKFSRPSGLCFDTFGNVIVADSGHDQVAVHRATTGLLLHTFGTQAHVRDLPPEPTGQPGEEEDSEVPSSRASTPEQAMVPGERRGSIQRRRRSSVRTPPPPAAPVKNTAPQLVAYNFCKRGPGSEGEGSFHVFMNKEIYVFKAARRVGAGLLSNVETCMFYQICEFLSYEEARPVACTARFLRDTMKVMRQEWKLWPFTPRGLMGTKKLFTDWCRTPWGDKLKMHTPPEDPKAPLAEGRTIICRHWVKDGKCPLFKIRGCPTKFYSVVDEEVVEQNPCIEFDHGCACAISHTFGFEYWYDSEEILWRIFHSLAVERPVMHHTGRFTGDANLIKHGEVETKVLDYHGFLEYMTILFEDRFQLKVWRELPCLHDISDLDALKRTSTEKDKGVFDNHRARFDYETNKVIGIMTAMFE